MNSFEQKTLDYLMTLQTEAEWQAWAATQDRESFDQVLSIIRRAQTENEIAILELQEAGLADDLSQAQEILRRF